MNRTADEPALDAVLDDDFIVPVLFTEFRFATGTIYLHTDLGTINTLSQDWLGVGDLGGISQITQDDSGLPIHWQAQLSAIDATIIDQALNQNIQNRAAILYVSARDVVTGDLVSDPIEIERGRMDQMETITGGEVATVQVSIESEEVIFDRSLDLYYSDNQQQTEFAGDLLYQYLPILKDKRIIWEVNGSTVSFNPSANNTPRISIGNPFGGFGVF